MRCTYCFEEHRQAEQMSFETAKKAVDFLAANVMVDNNTPSVSFFGGEPMLRWNEVIVPLVQYVRSTYENFGIHITTNGLLLNEERLKFFKDNNVGIMLSIDGAENGHNATRQYTNGQPTFDDLVPTINLLVREAGYIPFRMTVTPSNVQYFFESVQWFHNRGVQNLRAFPNIYEEWSDEAIAELDRQLKLYNNYIYSCFMTDQNPLIVDYYEFFFKKIPVKNYEQEKGMYRSAYFCQTCNRCGIGLLGNFMCNYKGEIFTCDRYVVADESNPCFVGNLDDGIDEAKISALYEMCNAENLHSTTLDCSACPLNSICSGGCIPVNYQLTGSFTEVPMSYCRWNQTLYRNISALLERFDTEQISERFRTYFQEVAQRRTLYVG